MCVLLRLWQDKRVNVGTSDSQGHNLPHSGNCGGGVKKGRDITLSTYLCLSWRAFLNFMVQQT